jgi:hypothetical protein
MSPRWKRIIKLANSPGKRSISKVWPEHKCWKKSTADIGASTVKITLPNVIDDSVESALSQRLAVRAANSESPYSNVPSWHAIHLSFVHLTIERYCGSKARP